MILSKEQWLGGYRYYPDQVVDMSARQKTKAQRTAIRSCDRCVHKSVCILYHGHGQLELRFSDSYAKDPVAFVSMLDERLARQCRFYLEGDSSIEP